MGNLNSQIPTSSRPGGGGTIIGKCKRAWLIISHIVNFNNYCAQKLPATLISPDDGFSSVPFFASGYHSPSTRHYCERGVASKATAWKACQGAGLQRAEIPTKTHTFGHRVLVLLRQSEFYVKLFHTMHSLLLFSIAFLTLGCTIKLVLY